jgi:hypothetical protein
VKASRETRFHRDGLEGLLAVSTDVTAVEGPGVLTETVWTFGATFHSIHPLALGFDLFGFVLA